MTVFFVSAAGSYSIAGIGTGELTSTVTSDRHDVHRCTGTILSLYSIADAIVA